MGYRRPQLQSITGFAVIAIPDTGLFVNDGEVVTGHGTEMVIDEMILFKRRFDATTFADSLRKKWEAGDKNGVCWKFPVIPVLVSVRL